LAKKKAAGAASVSPKLTEGEQDLLSHIQDGYQLETNSLGGDPTLRRLIGYSENGAFATRSAKFGGANPST